MRASESDSANAASVQGTGDARYAQLGAANAFAAANAFNGNVTLFSRFIRSAPVFSGSGNVSATSGSHLRFTGTAGGTLSLPNSNLSSGQEYSIQDEGGNAAASNIVVFGNGNNINGLASYTIATNYGRVSLRWSGTAWFGG